MGRILTRDGAVLPTDGAQDKALSALYRTTAGRKALSLLTKPVVSALGGALLDSRLSTAAIPFFVKSCGIDLSQFEQTVHKSYNSFFTRRLAPGARPIDTDPAALISPCDAKLTVYPITPDSVFDIKQSHYRIADLVGCERLAARFTGGQCLIFRLTVEDYHRFCYLDDGVQAENRLLGSELHTVNPIALEQYNIYKRNCRSVALLRTSHFGPVAQIEVGALFVGKIVNLHRNHAFHRGEEKGWFAFGGSTIVVLLTAGAAVLDADILANSAAGDETVVRFGSRIGTAGNLSGLVEKN